MCGGIRNASPWAPRSALRRTCSTSRVRIGASRRLIRSPRTDRFPGVPRYGACYMFANAGAVRIDHILGLFRLWWIRKASPPLMAHMHYDSDVMLGIRA